MISLKAKTRTKEKGHIPAVLYGPKVKNQSIEISLKEFSKVLKEAGESSLISLDLEGKKYSVLIHEVQLNPLTLEPFHVDFYQPRLDKEVEIAVPLVFEGVSLAVKDLGGTLIKEIQELEVKALPENLPHNIKVDISSLNTFQDQIKVKNLVLPENIKISKEPEEIIAFVAEAAKVEEELEKPIEEKVEEVEKVETKKEKEEEPAQETAPKQ